MTESERAAFCRGAEAMREAIVASVEDSPWMEPVRQNIILRIRALPIPEATDER